MRLDNWTKIAEILSGLAVVVTLIILIFEIQENTAVTKANSYKASVQSLNSWRYEIAANAELSEIMRIYYFPKSGDLTNEQQFRLTFLLSALWAIYEDAFYSRTYETLGDQEFGRYETQICFHYSIGTKVGTWDQSSSRITGDFKKYVSELCSSRS